MTLTIELPDETAERARAVAEAQGLDLRAFAVAAVAAMSEAFAASLPPTPITLADALADLLTDADTLELDKPVRVTNPGKVAFGQAVADKYRRQGFTL